MLGLVGKQLGERGVITHDELDHAIAKLEGAVAQAKQERAEHAGHFHEDEADHAHHEVPASLAQRVAPFLTMLREAKAGEADALGLLSLLARPVRKDRRKARFRAGFFFCLTKMRWAVVCSKRVGTAARLDRKVKFLIIQRKTM